MTLSKEALGVAVRALNRAPVVRMLILLVSSPCPSVSSDDQIATISYQTKSTSRQGDEVNCTVKVGLHTLVWLASYHCRINQERGTCGHQRVTVGLRNRKQMSAED